MPMGLGLDETGGLGRVVLNHVALAAIGGIPPDPRLLAMEQFRQHLAVMYVRRRRRHRMDQLRPAVHADMGLHAKVPLVPLLRLVHLWIPLLRTILRGTGGTDDRGIHNGPPGDLQPLLGQIRPDQHKQLFPQVMRFQQVAKLANGRFIGDGLTAQINPHKLPHGPRVIQRLLHGWIGQVEPMLQEVDAEHARNADRRTASPLGLGIKRCDHPGQVTPRNHAGHLVEKPLAARGLAIPFKRNLRKRLLLHGHASLRVLCSPLPYRAARINQRFLSCFQRLVYQLVRKGGRAGFCGAAAHDTR